MAKNIGNQNFTLSLGKPPPPPYIEIILEKKTFFSAFLGRTSLKSWKFLLSGHAQGGQLIVGRKILNKSIVREVPSRALGTWLIMFAILGAVQCSRDGNIHH